MTYETKLQQLNLTAAEKDFLDSISQYIDDNMADGHLTVEGIAESLKIHQSKLRRQLAKITGLTPNAFLQTLRMRHVLEMLKDYPRYSFAQIAIDCGFADHSHFTHTFNRLMDMSPTDYVRQLQPDKQFTI